MTKQEKKEQKQLRVVAFGILLMLVIVFTGLYKLEKSRDISVNYSNRTSYLEKH